jgi:hypothetical protein
MQYRVVCPASESVPGTIAIDLSSVAALAQSLRQLENVPFQAVLVLKNLDRTDPFEAVTGPDQLAGGLLSAEVLHPYTGLFSGFLRSLARELPGANCKQLNTSDGNLANALMLLEAELAQRSPRRSRISKGGGTFPRWWS